MRIALLFSALVAMQSVAMAQAPAPAPDPKMQDAVNIAVQQRNDALNREITLGMQLGQMQRDLADAQKKVSELEAKCGDACKQPVPPPPK